MKTIAKAALAERKRFRNLVLFVMTGLSVMGSIVGLEMHGALQDVATVRRSTTVLPAARDLLAALRDAETGLRGYLLTDDPMYLEPYRQGTRRAVTASAALQSALANETASEPVLEQLMRDRDGKLAEMAQTIALRDEVSRDAALAVVRTNVGQHVMDRFRADMAVLISHWFNLREDAFVDLNWRLMKTGAAFSAFGLLFVALLLVTARLQRRAMSAISSHVAALDAASTQDALTGLANRRGLLTYLQAKCESATIDARRIGLMYLDLDGFKSVNDALGHAAGDDVLRAAGTTFAMCVRENDCLARIGGDEFVVVLPGIDSDDELHTIAKRLVAVAQDLGRKMHNGRFPIGVTIGIATYPDRIADPHDLLAGADSAMYVAKQAGRCRYHFYERQRPANVVSLDRVVADRHFQGESRARSMGISGMGNYVSTSGDGLENR
ncbi:diguanylate cyclase [Burkholderia sp. Ac-20353]|uniref:diguanylate cyclase domain-containing protein n=1 Tax=Burkholderia sp. Ac-20353 TaxID=2703894 RepID=UPI00197B68F4|nr:diguanylate cyclase [Burkholderia sp. Ac-20353]MBN3785843.1 diguanylate cyclase [Burkholderia sp. Ac-20353]